MGLITDKLDFNCSNLSGWNTLFISLPLVGTLRRWQGDQRRHPGGYTLNRFRSESCGLILCKSEGTKSNTSFIANSSFCLNDCVHFLDTETEYRGENEVPVLPCEHARTLTCWWNFTFCSLIVHLNHRPKHSSFIEKLIAYECHPAPKTPTECLITCACLDKQILLRAAQWTKPYLRSFGICGWACWWLGKDMFILLSFHRRRTQILFFWWCRFSWNMKGVHLRALLLCQIWLKWCFQNLLLGWHPESEPSDW